MRPQIGLKVAKALSCDTDESEFFSGEPPLSSSVEKRRTAEIWRRPIWGRVGQGAFELSLPQIRKFFFLETLACLDISTKKIFL